MKHVILSLLLLVSVFSFFSCQTTDVSKLPPVETPKKHQEKYIYSYWLIPNWCHSYDNYEKKREDAIRKCEEIRDEYIADGYNAELYIYEENDSSSIIFDKPDYKITYVTIKIYPDEPTSIENTLELKKELEERNHYYTRWDIHKKLVENPDYQD